MKDDIVKDGDSPIGYDPDRKFWVQSTSRDVEHMIHAMDNSYAVLSNLIKEAYAHNHAMQKQSQMIKVNGLTFICGVVAGAFLYGVFV